MSPLVHRMIPVLAVSLAACGGDAPKTASRTAASSAPRAEAPSIEPCALLTHDEIRAVTGWSVAKADPSAYGATATCNFVASQGAQMVSVVVARGMPAMTSSTQMAEWRKKQGESFGDVKFIIAPVEGLGVPAIRNEVEGVGLSTIEAAVAGVLLDVTSSSLASSRALAPRAIQRLAGR